MTRDLGEGVAKPGVADSRAREDDVGEHLSKIGEPVQVGSIVSDSVGLGRSRLTEGRFT
jgi:hypothetical protein